MKQEKERILSAAAAMETTFSFQKAVGMAAAPEVQAQWYW